MTGFICGPSIYEFKGWLFEYHQIYGPWPLRRSDENPRARAGKRFWKLWDEFCKLTDEEKQAAIKHKGGCRKITMTVDK